MKTDGPPTGEEFGETPDPFDDQDYEVEDHKITEQSIAVSTGGYPHLTKRRLKAILCACRWALEGDEFLLDSRAIHAATTEADMRAAQQWAEGELKYRESREAKD